MGSSVRRALPLIAAGFALGLMVAKCARRVAEVWP